MLDTLKIKNLALIENLEVEFGKGLNIITGETGAGKSIIVNSLQLIQGKRGSVDIIRADSDRCEVEAIFDCEGFNDFLIIKRILTKQNRNKIKINDEYTTLNRLKELTENLIDFSAQNQYLFDSENQLIIYDLFCNLEELKKEYIENFQKYRNLKKSIELYEKERNKIFEKLDFLKFELKQLEDIPLENIDEQELKKQIKYIENIELIKNNLNSIYSEIDEKLSIISNLNIMIDEIEKLRPSFKEIKKILNNIEIEIGEILNICIQELKDLPEDNSGELDEFIALENKINELKKRFGKNSIKELIEYKKKIKQEINELENFEFHIEDEKKDLEFYKSKVYKLAKDLSEIRKKNKKKFEEEIEKILKQLNMEKAKFVVDIQDTEKLDESGFNKIEFLISTNEGEEPKPIKNIASGGEKSRIMLALKSFLSNHLKIPVLIFDEIDAGTGGETAFAIGKLLKHISKNHQVFAITHFPQVAAFADHHYKVFKIIDNGKTYTKIKKLNYEERIEELARMISGNVTEKSKLSAEELLNEAEKSNS